MECITHAKHGYFYACRPLKLPVFQLFIDFTILHSQFISAPWMNMPGNRAPVTSFCKAAMLAFRARRRRDACRLLKIRHLNWFFAPAPRLNACRAAYRSPQNVRRSRLKTAIAPFSAPKRKIILFTAKLYFVCINAFGRTNPAAQLKMPSDWYLFVFPAQFYKKFK